MSRAVDYLLSKEAALGGGKSEGGSKGEESTSKRRRAEPVEPPSRGPEPSPAPIFAQADTSPLGQLQNSMSHQFGAVLAALSTLPMQIARALPAIFREEKEAAIHARHEANLAPRLAAISACRTCYDLGELQGFFYSPTENLVRCEACFRYSRFAPSALLRGMTNVGIFTGDNDSGRAFKTVKAAVKEHIETEEGVHEWCLQYADQERKRAEATTEAGVVVGLTCLQSCTEHRGDNSFERDNALDSNKGLHVGTKNHSRAFAKSMAASFHSVLVSSITRLLTQPDPATLRLPPFTFILDKATMLNTTGQMHGIITWVEGKLVAIFLGCLRVRLGQGTGDGLAEISRKCLLGGGPLNLSLELIRRSLTCIAADGQYASEDQGHASGLQIQGHLCLKLNMSNRWTIFRWDGAHRIELGMDEVRRFSPWYSELASKIAETVKPYVVGKNKERLLQTCETIGLRLAQTDRVCETRFLHHERKVYKHFYKNLTLYAKDMQVESLDS